MTTKMKPWHTVLAGLVGSLAAIIAAVDPSKLEPQEAAIVTILSIIVTVLGPSPKKPKLK